MSDQKPVMSWSAMAAENKDVKIVKKTTAPVPAPAAPVQADTLPLDVSPLIAEVLEADLEAKASLAIEDEWKAEPFEAFKQGVAVTFLLWDALQLIINNGLVNEADAMSDVLEYDLIQTFIDTKGKIGPEDLDIWLCETMEQNFYTKIEDGSCIATAKTLVSLYHNCVVKKDFTQLSELMAQALDKMENGEEGDYGIFEEEGEGDHDHDHDDEDWDEDYDDEDFEDEDGEDEYAGPQQEEPEEQEDKPKYIIDEDGFKTLAPSSNQHRSNNKNDKKKK